VSGSTAQQRAAWLSEVTALVENAAQPPSGHATVGRLFTLIPTQ
jgi:hypothetical protein